jgi:hypothetical protein
MFNQIGVLALTGTLVALVSAASEAQSDWVIIGLVDNKSLVTIDPATRKATGPVTIKGTDARIAGFDVRPADGLLYGIASNGEIYTLDTKSGQTKKRSKLSAPWPPGVTTTIDFNPAGDRLRVMGSNGVNVTVNVDDGKVAVDAPHKYKDGDVNAGKTPKVIAGAFSQARKGAQTTALYVIDATTKSLLLQEPPNEGLLTTVGPLGINLTEPVAFNIVTIGDRNEAMLVNGGVLFSIDLGTGKATSAGRIEGLTSKLMDIAWMD